MPKKNVLGTISREDWEAVLWAEARAAVLDAADTGSWAAVQQVIARARAEMAAATQPTAPAAPPPTTPHIPKPKKPKRQRPARQRRR